MLKSSKVHPRAPIEPDLQKKEGRQCRICLQEQTSSSNPLMTPCDCKGSVQYIHENCVKQWIVSALEKKDQISRKIVMKEGEMECELCKYKVQFESCSSFECKDKEEIKQGISEYFCPFYSLIVATIIGLAVLSFSIVQFANLKQHSSIAYKTEEGIFFAMIVVMGIFSVIIIISIIKIFLIKEENRIISIKNKNKNMISNVFNTEEIAEESHNDLREIDHTVVIAPRRKRRTTQQSQQTIQNLRVQSTVNTSIFLQSSLQNYE